MSQPNAPKSVPSASTNGLSNMASPAGHSASHPGDKPIPNEPKINTVKVPSKDFPGLNKAGSELSKPTQGAPTLPAPSKQ
ncbi:hypothetical protein OC834_005321 [Tilletia horrida]|nr:hypothetical protein OC834_005321 [Tilletia horrida]KAK0562077.1 hypothetical protein OC844_002870 [Tilletia horrida]